MKERKENLPLINEKIRFEKMQLITQDGVNQGVVTRQVALAAAQSANLDLVIIAQKGSDGYPVAKVIDFGKLQYEKKKQTSVAKKKQQVIQIKEIKLRPKIADHDYQTKINQGIRFIEDGKRLKVTLVFRGREIAMKEERGSQLFDRLEKAFAAHNFGGKALVKENDAQAGGLWSRIYYLK